MANSVKEPIGGSTARYQIRIRGKIRENWSDWFSGMEISTQKDSRGYRVTTLIGAITDQAALRGILCKIWDLNLTVLSVVQIDMDAEEKESK